MSEHRGQEELFGADCVLLDCESGRPSHVFDPPDHSNDFCVHNVLSLECRGNNIFIRDFLRLFIDYLFVVSPEQEIVFLLPGVMNDVIPNIAQSFTTVTEIALDAPA